MTAPASDLGSNMRESAANSDILTARRVAYRLHFLNTVLRASRSFSASELEPDSSESSSLPLLLLLLLLMFKTSSSLLST
jgi:hypothetical protein